MKKILLSESERNSILKMHYAKEKKYYLKEDDSAMSGGTEVINKLKPNQEETGNDGKIENKTIIFSHYGDNVNINLENVEFIDNFDNEDYVVNVGVNENLFNISEDFDVKIMLTDKENNEYQDHLDINEVINNSQDRFLILKNKYEETPSKVIIKTKLGTYEALYIKKFENE
ncbi:MAG: hypothetical protein RLZ10_3039 [Bacteroidota bacterium]|jgi:hypothetical protein